MDNKPAKQTATDKFWDFLHKWLLEQGWLVIAKEDIDDAFKNKGDKCVFCDRKY